MQNEKIAVIALVVIIAGALSVYLLTQNQDDIFGNLFPTDYGGKPTPTGGVVEEGDCIDIQYIGRYASNDSIFDTSYEDTDSKTPGDPLRVFVTLDTTAQPPAEYQMNYSSAIIEGLMEQLIGLEQGKTYTLDIPDEKAYGEEKLSVGSTFTSETFAINSLNPALSLNQTLQVTSINSTAINLEWVDIDDSMKFTMPQIILGDLSSQVQEEMIIIPPPYFIWENSSEIQSINQETVSVITTPTTLEGITDNIEQINFGLGENDVFLIFPDATTATYDDSTITITSAPTKGDTYDYELSYFGQTIQILYTVVDVTADTINVSIAYDQSNETQFLNVNTTFSFDRIYEMQKTYKNIPMIYAESLLGPDIQREGISLHELAGEDLVFEVYVENVIKTSQQDS